MTELDPPRTWPPPSVWVLGLALVAPPATATGYDRLIGNPLWHVPAALTVAGLVAAGGLVGLPPLARWRAGPATRLAASGLAGPALLCLIYLVVSVLVAVQLVRGGRFPPGPPETVGGGLIGMTVVQLVALWWPETRRWCGLLPPADPDD